MLFKWPANIPITQEMNQEFDNACKLIGYTRLSKAPYYDSTRTVFERNLINDWVRCMENASNKCNQSQQFKNIVYQMLFDTKLVEKHERLTLPQFINRVDGLGSYIKDLIIVEGQIGEIRQILSSIKQLQTNTLVKTQDWIRKSALKQADKLLLKEIALVKQRLNESLKGQKIQQIPRNVNTAIIRVGRKQQDIIQQAPVEKERKQRQKFQKQYDENRKRLKVYMDSLKDILTFNRPQLEIFNEKIFNQRNILGDDKTLLFEIANTRIGFLKLQQKLSRPTNKIQSQMNKYIGSNINPSMQVVRTLQKNKQTHQQGQNFQKYEKLQLVAGKMTKQNEQLKRYISHNQRQLSDLRGSYDMLKRQLLSKNQWQKANEVSIAQTQNNSSSQSKMAQMQKEYQKKLDNMRTNEKKLRSSYAALDQMIEPIKQEAARLSSQLNRYKKDTEPKSIVAYDYQTLKQEYNKLRNNYQLLLGGLYGEFTGQMSNEVANSSQNTKNLQMIKLRQELSMKSVTLSAVSQKFQEAITKKQQKITSLQLFIQQLRIKLNKKEWSHSALPN